MSEGKVECPFCKGKKLMQGYACPGFRLIELPCHLCRGEGSIPAEQLEWIRMGNKLAQDRKDSDSSLREEAERLGILPSVYSDYENGRKNPKEIAPWLT